MKNSSFSAKTYILGTILVGLVLIAHSVLELDWTNPWLYVVAILASIAQTLKVEGPNARTNYSIAWFVYGFAFIALSPQAVIFVVVLAHLVEWIWHKYPWYIQSFNIGAHGLPVFLGGLVFGVLSRGTQALDLSLALGIIAANLAFVLGNHFQVGLVVKLARGQNFAESGVFELLTLSLDFTVLTLGTVAAFAWTYNPFLSLLSIPILFPLHHALRVPALKRQLQEQQKITPQMAHPSGD